MADLVSVANAEDRVKTVAYTLWLAEGQPEGRAEAHWYKALELVNAEAQPADLSAAKPKRKPAARKQAAS